MNATINGKRYNTEACEVLGSRDAYNNGNYSGCTSLLRANNGALLLHIYSNGQDIWRNDSLSAWPGDSGIAIDDFKMSEEQERRCAELGLIEIID